LLFFVGIRMKSAGSTRWPSRQSPAPTASTVYTSTSRHGMRYSFSIVKTSVQVYKTPMMAKGPKSITILAQTAKTALELLEAERIATTGRMGRRGLSPQTNGSNATN